MIKKLLRVLVVLVLLLIIGIVVAWLYVDHLAAKVLTGGIRYAGEVPCEVDSVGVSLLSGSVRVDELTVGNPRVWPRRHVHPRPGRGVGAGRLFLEPTASHSESGGDRLGFAR